MSSEQSWQAWPSSRSAPAKIKYETQRKKYQVMLWCCCSHLDPEPSFSCCKLLPHTRSLWCRSGTVTRTTWTPTWQQRMWQRRSPGTWRGKPRTAQAMTTPGSPKSW